MTRKHVRWLLLLAFACGPRVHDDHDEQAAGQDMAGADCDDPSCPSELLCGEDQRNCAGGLGMGECIDGKCGPVPMPCVGEESSEDTCADACARRGEGVVCVENGCEGATAFGYPGPAHLAIAYCGESNSTVLDAVVPIEIACDAPLPFTGEGSFELYQCCCDHPDY
jgi:hypothetical protein